MFPADPNSDAWAVESLQMHGPVGAEHGHRLITLSGTLLYEGQPVRDYYVSVAVGAATILVMVVHPTVAYTSFEVTLGAQGLMHAIDDEPAFPLPDDAGVFLAGEGLDDEAAGPWRACLRAVAIHDPRVVAYLTKGIDPETGLSCLVPDDGSPPPT